MPEENHSLMKELSDIKASLAVNTNETQNIKKSMDEIKSDIREIKNDFVNRRELNEIITAVYEQISPIKKAMYGVVSLIVLAVVSGVVKLIIK